MEQPTLRPSQDSQRLLMRPPQSSRPSHQHQLGPFSHGWPRQLLASAKLPGSWAMQRESGLRGSVAFLGQGLPYTHSGHCRVGLSPSYSNIAKDGPILESTVCSAAVGAIFYIDSIIPALCCRCHCGSCSSDQAPPPAVESQSFRVSLSPASDPGKIPPIGLAPWKGSKSDAFSS